MDTDTALADLYDTYPGAPDLSVLVDLVRDAGAVGRNPLAALTSTLLNAGLSTDEAEVSADAVIRCLRGDDPHMAFPTTDELLEAGVRDYAWDDDATGLDAAGRVIGPRYDPVYNLDDYAASIRHRLNSAAGSGVLPRWGIRVWADDDDQPTIVVSVSPSAPAPTPVVMEVIRRVQTIAHSYNRCAQDRWRFLVKVKVAIPQ